MDRSAALRRLRAKLTESDGLMTGMCCSTTHPAIVEIAGRQGHDFVILDAEHFSLDRAQLEGLIRAAEVHDVVSIVKLKQVDEIEVRDALDLGALGIMAPHIHGPEDIQRLIDACFFPPRGKRGVCGAARANSFSAGDVRELVKVTNEDILLIPVIEDFDAVQQIDEILAVDPSLPIYDIGPVDLALSMGIDLDRSIENPAPELLEALDKVFAALAREGKAVMYPTRYPNQQIEGKDLASWMKDRGVKLVYGFDTHSLVRGSRDILKLGGM